MIGIRAHPSKKGYVVVGSPLRATCGSNIVDKVKLMPMFGSGIDVRDISYSLEVDLTFESSIQNWTLEQMLKQRTGKVEREKRMHAFGPVDENVIDGFPCCSEA